MTVVRDVVRAVTRDVAGSVFGDGAVTAQTVIDLFNGGAVDGLFYNIADTTANNVARDGTGADVTDGAALGRRLDLSGNDIHGPAPTDAARGTWDLVSGVPYQTMDGSDDSFGIEHDFNALMRIFLVVNTSEIELIPVSNGITAFLFACTNSSGSTTLHNHGTPTYHINGSAFTGTSRDNARDAIATGSPIIWECEDAPLDNANWNRLGVSEYTGGFRIGGLVGSMIIIPESLIDSDSTARSKCFNFLAGQVGLPTI